MTEDLEAERRGMYRWAFGLSVVYVADGIIMTWALIEGGYAGMGYAAWSFYPVFIPAFILGLVAGRLYWQGLTRHGWTLRTPEWLFFFLLFSAAAAKVVVIVYDRVQHKG